MRTVLGAISNLTYPSASGDFAAVSVSEDPGGRGANPFDENPVVAGFERAKRAPP